MVTEDESTAGAEKPPGSPYALTASQSELLAWIVSGCPDGIFPVDSFAHRISARALVSRGLVEISGHGESWHAIPTDRGRAWPGLTDDDAAQLERKQHQVRRVEAVLPPTEEAAKVTRRARRMKSASQPLPIKQASKQEIYMRYKVVVTRVQVAERWIRAVDEEDAARKVQAEFAKPYAYVGHWETTASEVEVVQAEQIRVITPNLLDESGPMMLSLRDAAGALGIPHSALYELTKRGELEYTKVGSRNYIARESLMTFIRENTRRGYSPD